MSGDDRALLLRRYGQLDDRRRHHGGNVRTALAASVLVLVAVPTAYFLLVGRTGRPATAARLLLPFLAAALFLGLLLWSHRNVVRLRGVRESMRTVVAALEEEGGLGSAAVADCFPETEPVAADDVDPGEVTTLEALWIDVEAGKARLLQGYYEALAVLAVLAGVGQLFVG